MPEPNTSASSATTDADEYCLYCYEHGLIRRLKYHHSSCRLMNCDCERGKVIQRRLRERERKRKNTECNAKDEAAASPNKKAKEDEASLVTKEETYALQKESTAEEEATIAGRPTLAIPVAVQQATTSISDTTRSSGESLGFPQQLSSTNVMIPPLLDVAGIIVPPFTAAQLVPSAPAEHLMSSSQLLPSYLHPLLSSIPASASSLPLSTPLPPDTILALLSQFQYTPNQFIGSL